MQLFQGGSSGASLNQHIFERNDNGSWERGDLLEASDHTSNDGTNDFGKSLAISGNHVIIAARKNDAAYIFERDSNGNWGNSGGGSYDGGNINARTETQKLLPSDGTSGDSLVFQ